MKCEHETWLSAYMHLVARVRGTFPVVMIGRDAPENAWRGR